MNFRHFVKLMDVKEEVKDCKVLIQKGYYDLLLPSYKVCKGVGGKENSLITSPRRRLLSYSDAFWGCWVVEDRKDTLIYSPNSL